jgi:hypothetical protein
VLLTMTSLQGCDAVPLVNTRWFRYDRDDLYVNKLQFVPVVFEPPCSFRRIILLSSSQSGSLRTAMLQNIRTV